MAFNRVADWEIDKENPRTAGRHKLVSKRVGWSLVVVPSAAFVLVSWLINPLCFALSPLALVIIFFYSLTKRLSPPHPSVSLSALPVALPGYSRLLFI